MSVLIVGSSGYLGSSLLHYLSSYLQTYSFSRRQVNDLPKTTIPLNDVSPSTLKRYSIGTIINCSGSDSQLSSRSSLQAYKSNFAFPLKLLHSAQRTGCSVIQFSSFNLYAQPYPSCIVESSPILPCSTYSKSKHLAERFYSFFSHFTSSRLITLRLPNVFGCYSSKASINNRLLFVKILQSLHQGIPINLNNPYTHCLFYPLHTFLADILSLLFSIESISSGVYNIGFGTSLPVHAFASLFYDSFSIPFDRSSFAITNHSSQFTYSTLYPSLPFFDDVNKHLSLEIDTLRTLGAFYD